MSGHDPTPDDAQIDGCDLDFDDPDMNTGDDQIAALALYADIDFTDPGAAAARKAEWEALWASV